MLAGCADLPQGSGDAFDAVALERQMQPHRTLDPDEIRRRWGDYELLMGQTFISDGSNLVELDDFRWVVQGALARSDYLNCYQSTRKCDESWYWAQYDPAHKRINLLGRTGVPWGHAVVRPNGSLLVTRPNATSYEFLFDYDKDEGVFFFPKSGQTNRYIPTARSRFAEARSRWKSLDSETRSEEQMAARRREREESQERWENFNRGFAALNSGLEAGLQEQRRRQAESAALNARIARANEQARARTAPQAPSRPAPQPPSRPEPQVARTPGPGVSTFAPSATASRATVASAQPVQRKAPSRTREEPRSNLSPYPEAIVACTRPSGPNGSFTCRNPVTSRSGNLKDIKGWRTPEEMAERMTEACPELRRLPSTTHLVWGCGFAATGNSNSMDRSAGVDVKGRRNYYCYAKQTSCRRTEP
jgi:hypothetical protein